MMLRQGVQTCTAADFPEMVAEMHRDLEQGDLSDSMKEAAGIADKSVGRNFLEQAGPHSGPWPERKRDGGGKEIGDGHPLLIKSGDLFQAAATPFGKGHLEQVGTRSAMIGVDTKEVPYAAAQNFGRPDVNLVAREFEDLADEDVDRIVDVVADGVIELWL